MKKVKNEQEKSRKPELYAKYKIRCVYGDTLYGTIPARKQRFDIFGDYKNNGFEEQDYAFVNYDSVKKFFDKMVAINEKQIEEGKHNTYTRLEIIEIATNNKVEFRCF